MAKKAVADFVIQNIVASAALDLELDLYTIATR